ncbi:hypothetical protein COB72_07430 [bacterium]|nr:MAG: hypothetical protein COB72_07430 [bacterium]
MSSKKSKSIPFIAGFFVLILLAGFSLGLRTVIEFDAVNAQMRTSKFLFLKLPVIIDKQELWFADGTEPVTPIDWQLMHEFHHSATGSKLDHTHWGAFADTIILWGDLQLDADLQSHLAIRTREMMKSDEHIKAKRIYARRIDGQIRFQLENAETPLTIETLDTIIEAAFAKSIDGEASMLADP